MSAFVLSKESIDLLTEATAAMLQLNRKYSACYPLAPDTINILGKYTDDLHKVYRALYIANIRAVNGRYNEDQKTLPKYTTLKEWDLDRLPLDKMKNAITTYSTYIYQCCEEPVIYSGIWNALQDIRKLLCMVYMDRITER